MRIAISGTIGSGKTTVCDYLRSKGFKIFDCDECNRELLLINNAGYKALVEAFEDILDEDLNIDKAKLSSIVFSDKDKLAKLNAIMHPLILEAMLKEAENAEIFIAEVPLLFETEFKNYFDYKLLIACEDKIAIKHLNKRGFSEKEAKDRIAKQMNVKEKIKLADYVIYNNQDIATLLSNVDLWLERMGLC